MDCALQGTCHNLAWVARSNPFTEILDDKRVRLGGNILRTVDSDPLRQVTYEPGTATIN